MIDKVRKRRMLLVSIIAVASITALAIVSFILLPSTLTVGAVIGLLVGVPAAILALYGKLR